MRLLEPFAKDAQAVRPDELRNLLILAGTERELKNLMDTIDMFDIDWMAGMSAGVFTLTNSDVKSVMAELGQDHRRQELEPLGRHPPGRPARTNERAAGHHAATGVSGRGEEVDRPPGQDRWRRRRRSAVLRLQPSEPARGKTGPAAAAGIHRSRVAADVGRDPHDCARHAGRHHRQPTDVHAGQSGDGQQHHADAADAAGRRPRRGHRHRHRAQSAGRRRQGQQHAARSSPRPPNFR